MIDFKAAIERDIDRVFINDAEFSDIHDIDGVNVSCVIEKDMHQGAKDAFEGVFVNAITINVATEALDAIPVEGELLSVDGLLYLVKSVSKEMGMLVIVAEAHEQ